ncbi:reverse transcriptase domain-containing protein, partial [Tanacetum coccineum]
DNIQADGATRDTSRIRFFHFSLKGKAAAWLDRIPPTQIMTWDQLVSRFLDHFFPVPHHGIQKWLLVQIFYDNISQDNRRKLDQFAQFRFNSLTKEEGWNLIEEYVQYQDDLWDDMSPPMNVSSISEAMQPTFRGQDPTRLMNASRPTWPSRLKKQKKDDEDERLLSIFKQIHINLPFLEAMIHMPKGAKVLKDLLLHKEKLKKAASLIGTDISKITRKPSKTGKHGHEERKSTKEAKDSKPKPRKVNPWSILSQQK